MEILTWCDPKYFVFARGLIGSIRYHENKNKIHLCLLDFDEDQINKVKEIYKNDSQIEYIIMSSLDQKNFSVIDNNAANPDVNNGKIQFYRNFRPRLFLDLLNKSESEKICTFGANGIVFTKLDYIDDLLDDNDFVFMEREKNNVFTDSPKTVNCIEDITKLVVEQNISIDDILPQTTGKVVLLGTHAMRKSPAAVSILNRWIELIENTDSINTKFSDMNLFVKACVENQIEGTHILKKETGLEVPRSQHPFCDTSLIPGNKIWFAKGPQKFTSKLYHDTVKKFVNYKYKL